MANTITINVLGNTKGFQKSLSGINNDLSRLQKTSQRAGSFLKSSLKTAAVGAVAAGAAMGAFAKDSISAASDLNETISKTKTIFGDASPEIMRFGNSAARALGMSKQEALDGASTFGNFFDQIGIGTQESVKMSKAFVQMSADLGSFHNAAPVDVMDALAGATRGEYDALQKYIPTINAAAVQNKAFAMTGKTSADALTDAEKASALYALAIKGQGAAQGDFARTSNSLANQQKILAAEFENVKAKIGTALMPVVQQLMGVILREGVPALKQFSAWFQAEGPAAINSAVGAFQKFLAVVKPIAAFVAENIGLIMGLVGAFYAITAAVAAYNAILTAYKAIQTAIKIATIAWKNAQLALNLAMMLNPIGVVIAAIVALVAIFVIAYKKSETFRNIVDKSWSMIKSATSKVWGWIKDFIKGAFDLFMRLISNFTLPGLIIKHWDKIKSVTKATWNAVKNAIKAVWDWLKSTASAIFNGVNNAILNAWNSVKNATSNTWSAIKSLVSKSWNAIKSAVQKGVSAVVGFVRSLPGKIKGFFAGAGTWLLNAGKQILQGLLNGISSMVGAVKGKLGEITNLIPDWKGPAAKDKKLLRPVGKMIMEGLVRGFDDGTDGVEKSLGRITNLIEKTMDAKYKSDKKAEKASKDAIKALNDEVKAMMQNARARERMADRIEKAQERLKAVREEAASYAASVRDSFLDYGNVGNLGKDEDGNISLGGILGDLKKRVTDAKTYRSVLNSLIDLGLNKTTLNQLKEMGVEGGLATAQAILSGGKSAIAQVNDLTAALQREGEAMGRTLKNEFYGAGIEAAQGIVNGLKAKEKELLREARRLARDLTAAVKQELGMQTKQAVKTKINTTNTNKGVGGDIVNINVNVPPTANKAAIGKEIQKALDEYHRTGGTRRA